MAPNRRIDYLLGPDARDVDPLAAAVNFCAQFAARHNQRREALRDRFQRQSGTLDQHCSFIIVDCDKACQVDEIFQFRAIEHRRYFIRSANSGISAVVDPVGRVIAQSGTFRAERLDATVHWMHSTTPYEIIGDTPWYLTTLAIFIAAFRRSKPEA